MNGKYEFAIIISIIAVITSSIILPIDNDESEQDDVVNHIVDYSELQWSSARP